MEVSEPKWVNPEIIFNQLLNFTGISLLRDSWVLLMWNWCIANIKKLAKLTVRTQQPDSKNQIKV